MKSDPSRAASTLEILADNDSELFFRPDRGPLNAGADLPPPAKPDSKESHPPLVHPLCSNRQPTTKMGLDAEILFRCKNAEPALEDPLLNGFKIVPIGEYMAEECPGATHEIDTGSRYYGQGCERGPWPQIAAALMELLACEDVEKVWYGSDASTPQEIDADRVCEISRHYMAHGQRPYRRKDYRMNESSDGAAGCGPNSP